MADATQGHAASGEWREIDISSEIERIYHYPDGAIFTIPTPMRIWVLRDRLGFIGAETHRVEGAHGRMYRPERGWIAISWHPRPSEPRFVA